MGEETEQARCEEYWLSKTSEEIEGDQEDGRAWLWSCGQVETMGKDVFCSRKEEVEAHVWIFSEQEGLSIDSELSTSHETTDGEIPEE